MMLEGVEEKLKDENLTSEERQGYERLAAKYAGILFSTWFPVDWGRRLIMVFIFLIVGLYGILWGHTAALWLWLSILIFSPRVVGEVLAVLGRINSNR
ncbi:MAG: hypothetical protein PHC68_02330 [Syntrophorhabdaceae bacterium]|nr:hypothetical protein [Syntrophorhabdaceae bacterium]